MRINRGMPLLLSIELKRIDCGGLTNASLQGDIEKTLGWKPIPLFDRDHSDDIASMQVIPWTL